MSRQAVRHGGWLLGTVRHQQTGEKKKEEKGDLESARQIQIQFRTPGPRRMCPAVPFPSHLVGPAWCACQQVSGTNDEGSWRHSIFSHSISDGACRMASLYHTGPIAIVKQVIGHLHRVGASCVLSSHVNGRLERLSMQQFSLFCCQWI